MSLSGTGRIDFEAGRALASHGGASLRMSETVSAPTLHASTGQRRGSAGRLAPLGASASSGSAARSLYAPIGGAVPVNLPAPIPSGAPETMRLADEDVPPPVGRSRMDVSLGAPRVPSTKILSVHQRGSKSTGRLGNTNASAASRSDTRKRLVPRSDALAGEGVVAGSTYAIQSDGHMWHYVGRIDPVTERPARRRDIMELVASYEDAMQHAERTAAAAIEGVDAGGRSDPVLDQDFMNLRGLAEDVILEHAPPLPKQPSGTRGRPVPPSANHKLFQRGSDLVWRLAVVLFQQKWTDLVTSDAESQVGVSSFEHGRLIAELRAGHARVFGGAKKIITKLLQLLAGTTQKLDETQAQLAEARQEIKNTEQRMDGRYQERLNKVAASIASERDTALGQAKSAKDNADRMAETLKSLNGIFRQLRDDTDAMRDADLRDVCSRLEAKLIERENELRGLVHLEKEAVVLREQAASATAESSRLLRELEETKAELADRSALCQQVMQRENERLAELELMAQTVAMSGITEGDAKKGRRRSNESVISAIGKKKEAEAESTKSEEIVDAYDMYGASSKKTRQVLPESMLCIRCQARLDDLADLEDSDDEETKRAKAMAGKHPPCMYYRVMLPTLTGRRPTRPAGWVRWCLRAMLLAKEQADALAVREGRLRPRMPELVYSWFAPEAVELNKTGDDIEEDSAEAVLAATATIPKGKTAPLLDGKVPAHEAEENRWAFYYGLRAMAQEFPEAKLFHNFLDEKYGEDEVTFALYCMRMVRESTKMPIEWGPTPHSCGYVHIPPRLFSGPVIGSEEGETGSERVSEIRAKAIRKASKVFVPYVPTVVWIGLKEAMEIADQLMSRASDEDRQTVLWRIKAKGKPAAGRIRGSNVAGAAGEEGSAAAMLDGLDGEDGVIEELDAEGKGEDVAPGGFETQCIDLAVMVRMMLIEYREEQAHRNASLKLMFQTAQKAVEEAQQAEEERKAKAEGRDPATKRNPFSKKKEKALNIGFGAGAFKGVSVDFRQFKVMLTTMNPDISTHEVCSLYRDSYEAGRGGVTADSFVIAAQRHQFFSSCLRLPSYMGVSRRGELTAYQQSQLAFVVEKHFRTLDIDLLPWLSSHLTPDHITRINGMLRRLREAMSDDTAKLRRDGRYVLVLYRQLVDFLLFVRMMNREIRGEDKDAKAVIKVETELSGLDAVLRGDASALGPPATEMRRIAETWRGIPLSDAQWNAHLDGDADVAAESAEYHDDDDGVAGSGATTPAGARAAKLGRALFGTVRGKRDKEDSAFHILRRVNMLVCTIKIQRVFRDRQRVDHGVPWTMRKLMRVGYNPVSGAVGTLLGDVELSGEAKPKSWLLYNLAGLFLEKVQANVSDDRENQPHQALNTFLYDQALTKCGVRDLAERSLHELFTAVRAHMSDHPRVRVFALFCGIRVVPGTENSSMDKMLELDEAVEYYLTLLRVIQSKQRRAGRRRLSINYLFAGVEEDAPAASLSRDVPPSMVDADATVRVVETYMKGLGEDAQVGTRRVQSKASGGMVDLDETLMICMEEWARERLRREDELDSLFKVGDLNLDAVLALDEFIPLIKHAAPTKSDKDIVRMFREASARTDEIHRKTTTSAKLHNKSVAAVDASNEGVVNLQAFMEVARKHNIMAIKVDKAPTVPPGSDKEAQLILLQDQWKPFEHLIQSVVTSSHASPVSTQKLAERLAVLQRTFVTLDKKLTLKGVQNGWLAFRLLMSEWSHYQSSVHAHEESLHAAESRVAGATAEAIGSLDVDQVREMEDIMAEPGADREATSALIKKRAELSHEQERLANEERAAARKRKP